MLSRCPIKREERRRELDKYVSFCLRDRSFQGLSRRKWARLVLQWTKENPEYPWHPASEMPPHKASVLAARFDYEYTEYFMCVYNRHSRRYKSHDGVIIDNVTHWAVMPVIDPLLER